MPRHIREGQMIHSSLLHEKRKESDSDTSQSLWRRLVSIFYRNELSMQSYQPKASMKLVDQDEIRGWDDFYSLIKPGTIPLPSFVERDLYDLALELVTALRSVTPLYTHYLLRQFIFLSSSGES